MNLNKSELPIRTMTRDSGYRHRSQIWQTLQHLKSFSMPQQLLKVWARRWILAGSLSPLFKLFRRQVPHRYYLSPRLDKRVHI